MVSSLGGNATTAFANVEGDITAVDPATGKVIWAVPETKVQRTAFTVSNDTLYYAAGDGRGMEAVARSITDGTELWRARLSNDDPGPRLSLANGLLYAGGSAVHVLDAFTGNRVQTISVPDDPWVYTIVPINGHLYVGTSAGVFDYAAAGTP